jgi:RNA polymerase sigma factor (sigma-70 family)
MSTILHALAQLASTELTDGQLLGRYVTRRDAAAFETLVRRHGPMVLGVCRRLLPSLHDAEDAFQATFLVLVRKATTITPRDSVGSWLYGVAYRAAQKIRVAAARRRSKEVQVSQMPELTTVGEGLWHDMLPHLDLELALLPEKYRLPIVLCDLEAKTRKQAARQLGWPEGTVAGRLVIARNMLAKRLARHGLPLSAGVLAVVLSESVTQAAVPLTLVTATVRAATGGVMQTGISSVAEGVMRTMFLSKLKLLVVVLVVCTAIAAGAALVIGRPQQADKPGGVPGTLDAVYASLAPEKPTGAHDGKPDMVEDTAWGEAVDGIQAGDAPLRGHQDAGFCVVGGCHARLRQAWRDPGTEDRPYVWRSSRDISTVRVGYSPEIRKDKDCEKLQIAAGAQGRGFEANGNSGSVDHSQAII